VNGNGLAAAILVGGQSRRMGQDKALLTLAPDGPTVVESVARTLGAVTDEVVLVGADPSAYAFLGLPWIADAIPGAGPLAGIRAALAATERSHLLVVACDMPFLNADLLRYMATCPRDYDALVPVLDRPQPLHAIYARTSLPLIDHALRDGRYKVTGWFPQANIRALDRETIRSHDPDLRSCFNMNTPEDVAFAKQVIASPTVP
jgi:molybdopterin-guanine dinucleotide biosynthesis protein A